MSTEFLSRTHWITHDTSPALDEAARMLAVAVNLQARQRLEMRVSLVVHFAQVRGGSPPNRTGAARPGAVSLFGAHAHDARGERGGGRGYLPSRLITRVVDAGGLKAAVAELANERPGVRGQGVTGLEMHVWQEDA